MKKNEKIRTPLGIISVFKNEIPERYHCVVEPEILRISETYKDSDNRSGRILGRRSVFTKTSSELYES